MSDHRLGDSGVVKGNLDLPRVGAWTADVLLSATSAPTVGSVLPLVVGGTSRLGCVVEAGAEYAQAKCRVVGGRGQLGRVLAARQYRGESASTIAQDALRDAGEQPGAWTPFDFFCGHWLRSRGLCRDALRRLARAAARELLDRDGAPLDFAWRVEPDGTVDAVVDEWATAPAEFDILAAFPQERAVVLGVYDGALSPGSTIEVYGTSRRVERVLYHFDPDGFAAEVWHR